MASPSRSSTTRVTGGTARLRPTRTRRNHTPVDICHVVDVWDDVVEVDEQSLWRRLDDLEASIQRLIRRKRDDNPVNGAHDGQLVQGSRGHAFLFVSFSRARRGDPHDEEKM